MNSSPMSLAGASAKKNRTRLLALFLTSMVCLHLFVLWNARHLIRKGYPDFTIFYSAAKIVREGLGTQLYDPQVQYRAQQEFASGVSIRQGALPYNHPPFEALVFIPLTWLPYLPAYLAWDGINLLLLWAVLACLRPHVPLLRRRSGPAAGLFVFLAFFPVCVALLQGQDIIVLLLLLTLAFVSLRRDKDWAAGCWLGLGLFRFHLVLPLILVLALRKRYKALLAFTGVACGLALVSAAILGRQGMWNYPHYVWHVEQTMGHGAIVPSDMPNLRGLLATFLTDRIPKLALETLTAALSGALVLFAAAKWKPQNSSDTFDLAFSLCVVVTVLVSYHAFAYDLCLLLLPAVLIVDYLQNLPSLQGLTRTLLIGPVLILFISPLQMILWLRYGELSLLALVLGLWTWGIAREISREKHLPIREALSTSGTR